MVSPQGLSYTDSGSGLPLVLIHGFCESKEIWRDHVEMLSQSYRVICPDLPGFGESPLKKKEISIEYFAEKINELLTELDVQECVMMGHSLGGYVTLAFAEKYESKMKGIGLIHSTAYPDSAEKRKNRNKTIDFIEKFGVESFATSFVPPLFFLPNREKLKDTIVWITQMASATSKEGVIATTKAMRDRKGRADVLQDISVPVLFVIGEEDTVVTVDVSLEQASMPAKSVKHILSGVGHMGMIEKKDETCQIIGEFLEIVR